MNIHEKVNGGIKWNGKISREEVSWTFHLSSKKLIKFFKKREMSDEDRYLLGQRLKDKRNNADTLSKTTKNEKEKEG